MTRARARPTRFHAYLAKANELTGYFKLKLRFGVEGANGLELFTEIQNFDDLVQGVLSGRLDLALVTDPSESPSLSMTKVAEEPLWVAISEESPLAESSSIHLRDLDGLPWSLFARNAQPAMYDGITRQADERGIRWAELQEMLAPEEAFQSIVERNGVAVLTRSVSLRIARDGVTMRPLAEPRLTLKTYLACRSDNESKPVSEMVRSFGRKLRVFQEAA